jgi:hypothetical protein
MAPPWPLHGGRIVVGSSRRALFPAARAPTCTRLPNPHRPSRQSADPGTDLARSEELLDSVQGLQLTYQLVAMLWVTSIYVSDCPARAPARSCEPPAPFAGLPHGTRRSATACIVSPPAPPPTPPRAAASDPGRAACALRAHPPRRGRCCGRSRWG